MDLIVNIVGMILLPITLALFAWLSKLSTTVTNLRIRVGEDYLQKEELKDALQPIHAEMKHFRRIMEKVADRMHIPTVMD